MNCRLLSSYIVNDLMQEAKNCNLVRKYGQSKSTISARQRQDPELPIDQEAIFPTCLISSWARRCVPVGERYWPYGCIQRRMRTALSCTENALYTCNELGI